jgi:site-specific recombinase XerD
MTTADRSLAPLQVELGDLADQARDFMSQAKASNTLKAYQSDWRDFSAWCTQQGASPLPASPELVVLYLTGLIKENKKVSTLQRRISAISQAHQAAGHETPTRTAPIHALMAGIRRTFGTAQEGKAPVLTEDIRRMMATLPANLLGARDRALLLTGFAGAFRRSELVSLDVADVNLTRDGAVITLRRSKTDQEGQGRKIGIPYGSRPETCPVRAIQAWLEASGISEGALFRSVDRHGKLQAGRLSDKAVALVVKRAAEAAGLDPAKYAGHSLRAGLATSAAAAGASERAIMAQTGHRSVNMVRRYIRDGSLFRENAAATVGL